MNLDYGGIEETTKVKGTKMKNQFPQLDESLKNKILGAFDNGHHTEEEVFEIIEKWKTHISSKDRQRLSDQHFDEWLAWVKNERANKNKQRVF